MKKILILIILFKAINLIALNTEYPEINTYSEEWQKAGLNVDFPANNDYHVENLSNANGNNIQNKINNFNYAEVGKPLLINIDENIIEVGAYDDSLCVGAGVVVDGQAQILIYNNDESKDTQNIELVFIGNDKKRKKADELYKYDFDQDLLIELKDIVCDNEYMLLSLTNDNNESVNPLNISIASVYPNPFNPETTIDFNINHESQVLMSIYNLKGQLVKRLINDKLSAGNHKVVWNGKNDNNKSVASGIYFCKMKTDTKVVTKKMMLMK